MYQEKLRWGTITSALLASLLLVGCGGSGGSENSVNSGNPGSQAPAASAGAGNLVPAIQAKMAADSALRGVKVTEQGGAIALEGAVPSVAAKDRAEGIVTATQKEKGQPVGVLNDLIVK